MEPILIENAVRSGKGHGLAQHRRRSLDSILERVWPTGGRNKESFEAHCATPGAAVIRSYPSPGEALDALCLPIPDCFMYNRRSCESRSASP